ncbi:hypothetical protein DSO57_1026536 [Entomophthora muscae]|uniref:Uncharacterized protein n=1 Tax=Entomophthora muscae TaxID=34485 RepID=A0ACC2T2A1_9FUNG|nr:hypothetical protein DSO57_1026536 [Entomophthora muscae]
MNPFSSHIPDLASAPDATFVDEESELPAESANDHSNQPMKTSSLVDDEVMCNQPVETSLLVEFGATNFQPIGTFLTVIHEVPGYQPKETSPLCGTNPYMGPEPVDNSSVDTHNTPEEVEKAKHQNPYFPDATYPPI